VVDAVLLRKAFH